MTPRVFRTRRGRVTLTDDSLTYTPKGDPQQRVRVARADITLVRVVTTAYWSIPARTDVLVHHHGGLLTIPHCGRKTANALRTALGF
jgi:hypothetical protein